MITTDQILAAIEAKLQGIFPGEKIYENLVPTKFSRPSNMVRLQKISLGPALSANVVQLQYQYVITTFSEVDDYHNSQFPVLDLRALQILGLFAPGYLKVGGRALHVEGCETNHEFRDAVEILPLLSLNIDTSEFDPSEILPLMEQLKLKEANL